MNRRFATFSALIAGWTLTAFMHSAPLYAQSPCDRPDKFNHGREWASWTGHLRATYLEGFVSGQADTYLAMLNDVPANRRDALKEQLFTFHPTDSISNVMTDLYRDPANAFIPYGAMVYIARDKLSGRDIEPKRRYSRQFHGSFGRQ